MDASSHSDKLLIAVFDATLVFCGPKFMGERGQAQFGLLVAYGPVPQIAHDGAARQALDALRLGFLRAARSEGAAMRNSGRDRELRIEEGHGASCHAMIEGAPWSDARVERAARSMAFHAQSKLKRALGAPLVCAYECVPDGADFRQSLGERGILSAKHVESMRRRSTVDARLDQWNQLIGSVRAKSESLQLASGLSGPSTSSRPSSSPRL